MKPAMRSWIACLTLLTACAGARPAWEYHYDRNALVASQPAGDSIIALTKAGHLLRFDAKTLALSGEKLEARKAMALGRAQDGGLLAGFSNGLIGRLDPLTLEATTIGTVRGRVVWIGDCVGVGLVIGYQRAGSAYFGYRSPQAPFGMRFQVLATRQDVWVRGSSPHCDRSGRLWVGSDEGEWGGRIEMVDLRAPRLERRQIAPPDQMWWGVYGFIELPDGSLVAYGGPSHMGFHGAFLARVSETGKSAMLYNDGADDWGKQKQKPDGAYGPISHVLPARDGGFFIFALGRVYRCDDQFRSWKLLGYQKLHSASGRPDAVGNYPALVAVHTASDGRILLTTRLDGIVEWDEDEGIKHTLANQAPDSVGSIVAWDSGVLVVDRGNDPYKVLRGGVWRSLYASLPEMPKPGGYLAASVLPADDGQALVVAAGSASKDDPASAVTLVTAMIDGERVDVLGTQATDRYLPVEAVRQAFQLADGTPAMRDSNGRLWSFESPLWRQTAAAPEKQRLDKVKLAGKEALVEDSIALDKNHLLIATDPVLCKLDSRSKDCEIFRTGATDEARRLARDSRGRIWIAGRGLWRLDGRGHATPYPLPLPFSRDAEVESLAASGDRLVLALGDRGIALLDPDAKADASPEEPSSDFEPRYEDGAVIVTGTPPPDGQQEATEEFELQFEVFEEAFWNDGVLTGPRDASASEDSDNHFFQDVFHTPDPDRLAAQIAEMARKSPASQRLRVMKRGGPRGYFPLVEVFAGRLAAPVN